MKALRIRLMKEGIERISSDSSSCAVCMPALMRTVTHKVLRIMDGIYQRI